MALDKVLKIYDDQGNEVDYDILAKDVKFTPDGKDLPTKLAEMEQEIGDAGQVNEIIMNGQTYTPTNKVIDLGTVITQHQDISGKVDKVTGKGLSTNDFTDAEQIKLAGIAAGAQVNVINGIQTHDGQTLTPQNGIVTLPPAGSTISPASNSPIMDGTADVGSSDKYAREDHVHPHDSTKANVNDVYSKTDADTLLAGKQSKLTFDAAPVVGSNNPVKSGGIYDAINAMLSQVTVNAIPAGSVAVENNLASSSETNALSASMGAELYALIQILFHQLNMIEVSEDGLYFIDSNDNIGVCIDSDGLHAINILEHVITG